MQKAAIYARYSTDEQRATSIDDQVRRTREHAEKLGFTVFDRLIFSDASVTGTAKGRAKRIGYDAMLRAWDNKEFDAIIVDELSRLARDPIELAHLQVRVEKTRVRLISSDGLDSTKSGWQLQFGFSGVMASHFVRETGHRVIRGMQGQLERGFMIAQTPIGYTAVRESEEGTKWIISEAHAERVRMIFEMRRKGATLMSIAKTLNDNGVPTPRKSKKSVTTYWRPGTIRQLLRNAIYRGVFVWNGSAFSKAKEKRGDKSLEPKDYQRPELRIVDDDTWFACNQSHSGWRVRGGDKHVFAGLLTCGICQARLTVSTGGSAPSLHCSQCAQAKRVGVAGKSGRYISCSGVQAALIYVLEKMFSDEMRGVFQQKLKARLEGGHEQRLAELKLAISQREKQVRYFVRLLSSSDTADPVVEQELTAVIDEKRKLEAEHTKVDSMVKNTNVADIQRQLSVNPVDLIPKLFKEGAPAERARALLRRLFPLIATLDKADKYTSNLLIKFAPGIAMAEGSKTAVLDTDSVEIRLKVTGGPMRPTRWGIEEI